MFVRIQAPNKIKIRNPGCQSFLLFLDLDLKIKVYQLA